MNNSFNKNNFAVFNYKIFYMLLLTSFCHYYVFLIQLTKILSVVGTSFTFASLRETKRVAEKRRDAKDIELAQMPLSIGFLTTPFAIPVFLRINDIIVRKI